jgi:hypothetical protein
MLWVLICLSAIGCGSEQEHLFEEEHERPAHWPSGPADAAQKIRERLDGYLTNPKDDQYREQLLDLVEWAPEIAAETDLAESDWNPIHGISEAIRQHLNQSDVTIGDVQQDFIRLAALLERAEQSDLNREQN